MASVQSALPFVFALVTTASPVGAAEAQLARHHALEHTDWQFLTIETSIAVGAYASAWLFTGGPKSRCAWCRTNAFDVSARDALRADAPRAPAFLSHALSLGAIPILGLTGLIAPAGLDRQWHRGLEDTWIVFNAFAMTSAVSEAMKHIVARERPAFHYGVEYKTEFAPFPSERNKSFFSLDTAWAFAIASASATLAFSRGYSTAPYVALGGGVMAVGTGILRIVGDAHWATDVITGAVVGTGIGVAMPLLLHGRRESGVDSAPSAVSLTPLARGSGVTIALRF